MPVFEYVCPECKTRTEELVKNCECELYCKKCGKKLERVYSGKVYTATGAKSSSCGGDCRHCKGCK